MGKITTDLGRVGYENGAASNSSLPIGECLTKSKD